MKKYIVDLSELERKQLLSIISKRKTTSEVVKRAYILLSCDINGENNTDVETQKEYHIKTLATIERLRKRFVIDGFEIALFGKIRTVFLPRKFDGKTEAQLVSLRCSNPPNGYDHWSLMLLAKEMIAHNFVQNISHETCRQILKKTKLSLGK